MKTKTEVIAFEPNGHVERIFFTIPDGEEFGVYDAGYLDAMLTALKKHGIVLEDDDEERNVGIVSKKTANKLAGVKLAGSKTVYADYVLEYQSAAKDIPATLKKIAKELPAPAEVVILSEPTVQLSDKSGRKQRVKITDELKAKVVASLKAGGKTPSEIADENGISVVTVVNIKRDMK